MPKVDGPRPNVTQLAKNADAAGISPAQLRQLLSGVELETGFLGMGTTDRAKQLFAGAASELGAIIGKDLQGWLGDTGKATIRFEESGARMGASVVADFPNVTGTFIMSADDEHVTVTADESRVVLAGETIERHLRPADDPQAAPSLAFEDDVALDLRHRVVAHVILAHPFEAFLSRPVAAQTDLDEVLAEHVPVVDKAAHRLRV